MRKLLSPLIIWFSLLVALGGMIFSNNYVEWLACAAAAPAIFWILGGSRAPVVLLWICGMMWLRIPADVLLADLQSERLSEVWFAEYRINAILFSLAATVAMAVGMRCALGLGSVIFRRGRLVDSEMPNARPLRLMRLLPCYLMSWVVTVPLTIAANAVPGLQQAAYTFGYLRYAFLYLIALHIFERNRGYQWLMLVAALEVVLGFTSYFSAFKEPLFVIVIAFIMSRGALNPRALFFGAFAIIGVFWLCVVWSGIKIDFRQQYGSRSLEQNVQWVVDRVLYEGIDYNEAATLLLERVGYTTMFSQILARTDVGVVPDLHLYMAAIEHVLKPRILFPNKAALDDSILTTALTGTHISEGTSVGVGFVAEAGADFGFPMMLAPIAMIGGLLGTFMMYFLSRPVPLVVRQAFATATLFSQFSFEANIDKCLGGAIMGFIMMAFLLKFGYPLVATWLTGRGRARPAYLMPTPNVRRA